MKIGLVGEAPNDVQSIKNLFERFYKVEDDFEFIFLLNNINGSQLEQQKTKHFLSLEYRLKKPDIVIFIRDLDGLKNNSTQVTLRKQYFTDFNSVVNRNGILLLHIYEIEALILSESERLSNRSRLQCLSDRLVKGIVEKIPDAIIDDKRLFHVPEIINVSFQGVEGESILLGLDFKGIAASSGSACSSASVEPSHVLLALGQEPALAVGSVRFSLGRHTTDEDITDVLQALPVVLKQLRMLSPST